MPRTVVPHTVKPRKPNSNADRTIYVIIDDSYSDEQGSIGDTTDLLARLQRTPPCIIASANESAKILKRVQDMWGKHPDFQFRVSPIEREIFTPRQTKHRLTLSLLAVSWFGWCDPSKHANHRYHLLIDPLTFSGQFLPHRDFATYLQWAQELRAFCLEQNWNLRPTQGSVGRQALQDPRFYPEARRKVPRATNDRVRPHLPGNHYQLVTPPDPHKEYEADYIDQSRCHHFHAINAALPDCNYLRGYGNFRHPESGKYFRRTPKRIATFCDGFMGMLCVTIWWPPERRSETLLVPKFLQEGAHRKPVYIYSEDLPLLDSLGVRITGIIAAWGSKRRDEGLARYGKWAIEELDRAAPGWKKSLLLSPYGALATTPRKQAVAYHRTKPGKGVRRLIRSKSGIEIPAFYCETTKVTEPSTNNVLHRALIEASNRSESLMYAHFLEGLGRRILSVYVDALMVETDEDYPSIPLFHPWRLDRHLTRLRFLSESQFTSNELRKLPGISGQQIRDAISMGTVGVAPKLGTRAEQLERVRAAALAGRGLIRG